MESKFDNKYIRISELPIYELANTLRGHSFKILIILLLNYNENGTIFPLDKMTEICGLSESTVILGVDKIGKLMLGRKKPFSTSIEGNSIKLTVDLTKHINIKEKKEGSLGTSAKKVLDRFNDLYLEKYGEKYQFHIARDMKLLKDGVCQRFTIDEIFELLDIAFNYYDIKWKTGKFPRLTIGAFGTWVYPQCSDFRKQILGKDFNRKVDDDKERSHADLF